MPRVTVQPALFAWSCQRARLDEAALAAHFPRLQEWETGVVQPTLRQLEQYAQAIHAAFGFYFLPAPPEKEVPIPEFRTLRAGPPRLSADLLDVVYTCQSRKAWYRDEALVNGELAPIDYRDEVPNMSSLVPTEFGLPLTPAVRSFLNQAATLGFTAQYSSRVRTTNTLRVVGHGLDVGYINSSVLPSAVLGYRFRWTPTEQYDACPRQFEGTIEQEFCRRYGCTPADFEVQRQRKEDTLKVYLVVRTVAVAVRVLQTALGKEPETEESDVLLEDIALIEQSAEVAETTREALIDARLGQGKFRQDLIQRFGRACAVTGCSFLPLLRASHIKPWSESTNAERLDPDNGLLLTANLDALFDRGLISFSDKGELIRSQQLPYDVLAHLGPLTKLPLSLSAEQRGYLKHHRARFGLKPH